MSPDQEPKLGELLVQEGLITEDDVKKILAYQKEQKEYVPFGDACVALKLVTKQDLNKVLDKYKKRIRLGDLLINLGFLTQTELNKALADQKKSNDKLGNILVKNGVITEDALIETLSVQIGIPKILPDINLIDKSLLKQVKEGFLVKNVVLPAFKDGNKITAIMSDPLNEDTIQNLKYNYRAEIEPAIAPAASILEAIKAHFHPQAAQAGAKAGDVTEKVDLTVGDKDAVLEDEANVVSTFNYIMCNAVSENASDIHIEPREKSIRIRYRVDGILQHKTDLPSFIAQKLISRIKVLSGVDIAEKRRHQDGRIQARILDKRVDLRVSVYAAVHGENVVIRILHRQSGLLDLDELGFSPANRLLFEKVLDQPSGALLTTGPTGSGKTTTLYAALNYLNDGQRSIITVEDPVEYLMEGIVQGQMDPKIGHSFVDFLRSMMRQDPDVIMLGEIRDGPAAQAAIQAALTGHKVLSTFHSDDATGALLRLLDMGIEPFLISSTLNAIISQRLVRILCPECREAATPEEGLLESFNITAADQKKFTFYKPKGCSACNQIGYKGRTAVHELLWVNEPIRNAIQKLKNAHEIRTIARYDAKLISMREDGLYKAVKGRTSLEEVLRIVFSDDSDEESPRSAAEVVALCEGGQHAAPESIEPLDEIEGPLIELVEESLSISDSTAELADGEVYRIRFDADLIDTEQDRIAEFFKIYQKILAQIGKALDSDLHADFSDFITYTVKRLDTSLKAELIEFCIHVKKGAVKILVETLIPPKKAPAVVPTSRKEGMRLVHLLKTTQAQAEPLTAGSGSTSRKRSYRGRTPLIEFLKQGKTNSFQPVAALNPLGSSASGTQLRERPARSKRRQGLFKKHVEELELTRYMGEKPPPPK